MAKIKRAGGRGIQIGDTVVHKDDSEVFGIVEGFTDDGEVEVRWEGGPAISWEQGSDLEKVKEYNRGYSK